MAESAHARAMAISANKEARDAKAKIGRKIKLPDQVPHEYICPISLGIMKNPVTLQQTNQTYDNDSINAWFKQCTEYWENRNEQVNYIDPLTGIKLTNLKCVKNIELQDKINEYKKDVDAKKVYFQWVKEHQPASNFECIQKEYNDAKIHFEAVAETETSAYELLLQLKENCWAILSKFTQNVWSSKSKDVDQINQDFEDLEKDMVKELHGFLEKGKKIAINNVDQNNNDNQLPVKPNEPWYKTFINAIKNLFKAILNGFKNIWQFLGWICSKIRDGVVYAYSAVRDGLVYVWNLLFGVCPE